MLISTRGRTPLIWAASRGNEAVVRLLIERGVVDINAKDKNGWILLSMAAESGFETIVQLLVERGDVDINAKDLKSRWAPLF